MHHFQLSLSLDADPATVYAALTTPAGLRGWWTRDCDVAAEVGGTNRFRFGRTYKDMRIEHLAPGREVRWLCTRAFIDVPGIKRPDEWVDTRVVFRLAPLAPGRTRLDFEHQGLVPAFECYEICNRGWRQFLDSLGKFVATGRGAPYEPAPAAALS